MGGQVTFYGVPDALVPTYGAHPMSYGPNEPSAALSAGDGVSLQAMLIVRRLGACCFQLRDPVLEVVAQALKNVAGRGIHSGRCEQ